MGEAEVLEKLKINLFWMNRVLLVSIRTIICCAAIRKLISDQILEISFQTLLSHVQ